MRELTFEEIERIGKWKPYRSDWPVNRNLAGDKDGQTERYRKLIHAFNNNAAFKSIQVQDGGKSNFIEFICFKHQADGSNIEGIDVFINLCAPIATYGQVRFFKRKDSFGNDQPEIENLNRLKSKDLSETENGILKILSENNVTILSAEFLNQDLLAGLTIEENLLEGKKMFNYLFQWID